MPTEGAGGIAAWAQARGHQLTTTAWYAPNPVVPPPASVDLLVVLGGAMSVHDEADYPWLATEKAVLRRFLEAGRPMLGICLGSQLLAQALGAGVVRNAQPEIGFFPIEFTPAARAHRLLRHAPPAATVLHWHTEVFMLPPEALPVAASGATACQGFVWADQVVGLQFHPEMTTDLLEELIGAEGAELRPGAFVQPVPALRADTAALSGGPAMLYPLLDALLQT